MDKKSIKIIKTSKYAESVIKKGQPSHHSTYNSTINLLLDDEIFALQNPDSVLSPISLIAESNVDNYKEAVKNGLFELDFSQSKILDTKLNAVSCKDDIPVLFKNCFLALKKLPSSGMIVPLFERNDGDFALYYDRVKSILENGLSPDTLPELIGLGTGLTPGGDDFLCGVLAVFFLTGLTKESQFIQIKKALEGKLSNTNDISRAFLRCAMDGQFSEPVCALSNPKVCTETDIYDSFSKIGHSSGTDTLCGIYFALKALI